MGECSFTLTLVEWKFLLGIGWEVTRAVAEHLLFGARRVGLVIY